MRFALVDAVMVEAAMVVRLELLQRSREAIMPMIVQVSKDQVPDTNVEHKMAEDSDEVPMATRIDY